MKRLLVIAALILIPLGAMAGKNQPPPDNETVANDKAAKAAVVDCIDSIEVLDGTPTKPYAIISVVSEKPLMDTTGPEKLLPKLKKKACKLGADALIKYECHEVTEGGSYLGHGHGYGSISSVAVCSGTAVKWK